MATVSWSVREELWMIQFSFWRQHKGIRDKGFREPDVQVRPCDWDIDQCLTRASGRKYSPDNNR